MKKILKLRKVIRIPRIVGNILTKQLPFQIQYYFNPFSQYNSGNTEDSEKFEKVLGVWRPKDGTDGILLRWLITTWCNYGCPYCDQDHRRHPHHHALDYHDVSEWLERFDAHFHDKKLSLVLTGGEPLIDAKNMPLLLKGLTERPYVSSVRIDTNASVSPAKYDGVDVEKIWLMCTYHPSGIEESKFIEKIKALQTHGFKIGMVNYVMFGDQIEQFEDRAALFSEMGIPFHPNPLWDSSGYYSEESLALLKEYLHPLDFKYRSGASTFKKKCLFPSIGYEMNQTGRIQVGCHPYAAGNFFENKIPKLPAGPVSCPMKSCKCLDKYSFLSGFDRNTNLNPFEVYHQLLMGRGKRTAGL